MSSQNDKEKSRNIKKMALLLREGHTLLSDACPQCNAPLFKMKSGEIYCAACDRKVIIVKDDDQIDQILQNKTLDESTKVIIMKIKELNQQMDIEKNFDDLYKISRLLINFLEALEKLRELKKN